MNNTLLKFMGKWKKKKKIKLKCIRESENKWHKHKITNNKKKKKEEDMNTTDGTTNGGETKMKWRIVQINV